MPKATSVLQPRYFGAFRCIGSDCEDTCCIGWTVMVDKQTYGKYQHCSDPELGSSLRSLITINVNKTNDDDYAKITLSGSRCPFLSENLCSIQKRLGEEYLSNMCATYPRVMNMVDEVLQGSLDLSCPEAARLVLLNPSRIEFDEQEYTEGFIRPGIFPALDTSGLKDAPTPYRLFRDVQRLILSVLQDRSCPLWKRVLVLGGFCDRLAETADQDPLPILQNYLSSVGEGLFPDAPAQPAVQLEVVVELILARIGSDFTPPRFLDCYREFMNGIQWTTQSTMDEIGFRYAEAYSQYYAPFMNQHEYLLEHYLVNYVYRTQFPFALPGSNERVRNDRVESSIAAQYMLMIVYYAITKTVLIGMAGLHGSAFGFEHVVKLVQLSSRTFEHSLAFPARAIEMLVGKDMTNPASLRVLMQN